MPLPHDCTFLQFVHQNGFNSIAQHMPYATMPAIEQWLVYVKAKGGGVWTNEELALLDNLIDAARIDWERDRDPLFTNLKGGGVEARS